MFICYLLYASILLHVISNAHDINVNELSEKCAKLAAISYCTFNKLSNYHIINSESCVLDTILYNSTVDANGFICHDDLYIYTVLRGSTSIQDWKNDMNIKLVNYDKCANCLVHEGFCTYAMSIQHQIISVLRKYPNHKQVFTGHSLGASVLLNSLEFERPIVVTFGSPRIGNIDFAEYASSYLTSRTFRYTHNKDVVPHLPTIRFMHILNEMFEDETGHIKICNGYEDTTCANQYAIIDTNTADHMLYLNTSMECP